MPWTPEQFKAKHNKKLSLSAAKHAAQQAEAMIANGVSEGVAIATANKYANKSMAKTKGFGAVQKKGGK